MNEEMTFGEKIQAHVELAIATQKHVIDQAVAQAEGCGVWVEPEFTVRGIIIHARPDVRVPYGSIQMPDFSKYVPPPEMEVKNDG